MTPRGLVALILLLAASPGGAERRGMRQLADRMVRQAHGLPASGDYWRSRPGRLRQLYYQELGHARRADDPRYQLAVTFAARDGDYGHASDVDVKITRNAVHLKQHLLLEFDPSIPPARREQFRQRIQQAVAAHLDDRLEIVPRRGRGGERRRLRLSVGFPVRLEGDADRVKRATVKVHGGQGRSNAAELYLEDSPAVIAHELCHRMLNAQDEYTDEKSRGLAPGRDPHQRRFEPVLGYDPGSLMRCTYDRPTLLPYHTLSVGRLIGRLTGEPQAVALAPRHRLVSMLTPQEVLRRRYSGLVFRTESSVSRALSRAGWPEGELTYVGDRQDYAGFRRGVAQYLAFRRLRGYRHQELVRPQEPLGSDAYLLARELATMVGEQELERLVFQHGAGCVEKLEARLADRITPAGRRLIERHGIRHPLGEILRGVMLERGEVLFDELVGIYGATPRTAAVRQQIVKNRPPPIGPW